MGVIDIIMFVARTYAVVTIDIFRIERVHESFYLTGIIYRDHLEIFQLEHHRVMLSTITSQSNVVNYNITE